MKNILGVSSYRIAWASLHKLRCAMVIPEREKLSEEVAVDETYIGGKKHGKRGRGSEDKALVAVEDYLGYNYLISQSLQVRGRKPKDHKILYVP